MAEGGEVQQPTAEDFFAALTKQNGAFREQTEVLRKMVENTVNATAQSGNAKYSGTKIPSFSGKIDEDVNEFFRRFVRAANFHGWKEDRKAQALSLHLLSNTVDLYLVSTC